MAIFALGKIASNQAIEAISASLPHCDRIVDEVAAEILMCDRWRKICSSFASSNVKTRAEVVLSTQF
ncbi:MAG: hypothetical protein AAGG00_07595 [Cyanobacteria bacterium P01_H01_bin.150]